VRRGTIAALVLIALAAPISARSAPKVTTEAPEPKERTIIVGAGLALEVESGTLKTGVATFVEYEALEGALEVELGGQGVWGGDGRELSADLLAKWPRRITERLEVMIGAGPTVVATKNASWGIEGAIDVMWWPMQRFGLWVEPSYEILFVDKLPRAAGLTAGPIVGW
jgi:hypothetical protein